MPWSVKKTIEYDMEVGAQRVAAVHNIARHNEKSNQRDNDIPIAGEYEVQSGNAMIDQFERFDFGVAFAFVFTYCTGMPHILSFLKKPTLSP